MFSRILLPLDRSALAECVLPHAVALAHVLDAEVILLHVLSVSDTPDRLRAVDPLEWQLRRAEAESYLQTVCARLQDDGVSCMTQVNDGDAAEQIVDFAHDNEIGLVLLASHGQSGLNCWNVSSVVQKVIMRSRAALMIVRASESAQTDAAPLHYGRIMLPLDGSARAECVLPLATILARVPETQILLAHVVERPEMPRRTPPSQEDLDLSDRIVERNRIEAENYLEVVRLQLPTSVVETRLLTTNRVATALHELIEQERIDLVLLSAHGYSGDTRWPHGGVVAHVVTYGARPMLIFQDAPGDQPVLTQAEAGVRSSESL